MQKKFQMNKPIANILISTSHGLLIVNRNDYRKVDEVTTFGVGHQLLSNSCFDPEEIKSALLLLDLRREYFGDGVVGIDCGANIGVHTIEWANHMYGWGFVHAFEAQERVFYNLAGNIALNNCFNATAVCAAVGSNVGRIYVPILDFNTPASYGSLEIKPPHRSEFIGQFVDHTHPYEPNTNLVTIDSINMTRLDLLKIDVEGMESDVLAGSIETIVRHKPIIIAEHIKSDSNEIICMLEDLDYSTFYLGINILAVHASDPCLNKINVL